MAGRQRGVFGARARTKGEAGDAEGGGGVVCGAEGVVWYFVGACFCCGFCCVWVCCVKYDGGGMYA